MFDYSSGVTSIYEMMLDYKNSMSSYDIESFDNSMKAVTESSIVTGVAMKSISSMNYLSYVDKCTDNLSNVSVDTEKLIMFFNNVYKSTSIDSKNIGLELRNVNEITKIRPQYIMAVSDDCRNNVSKIISSDVSIKEIKDKMLKDEYFTKMKQRMIATSLPTDITNDFAKMERPEIVKITGSYIMNSIIPSLKLTEDRVKDIFTISAQIKTLVSKSSADILTVIRAIDDMDSTGKISNDKKKLLNYYIINLSRKYMDICCYLCYMFNRYTIAITYNLISYNNLYNTINNYFPEGESVLHENAIDGDISDIENDDLSRSILHTNMSIVYPFIDRVIGKKKMEICNAMSKVYDDAMDVICGDYEYDMTPYTNMSNIFTNIRASLVIFNKNAQDVNMTADDIQEKSGFTESLMVKFNNIVQTLDGVGLYNSESISDNDKSITVYHELTDFKDNVSRITENVKTGYEFLNELIEKFNNNTNNEFTVDETRKELLSLLESIKSQYKELALTVAKKIISRLDNLAEVIGYDEDYSTDNNEPSPMIASNYLEEAVKMELDEADEVVKSLFESRIMEYNAIRNRMNRGVKTVYESDEPTDANKPDTSVTLETDKNKQEQNQNQNQSDQNSDNDPNKKKVGETIKGKIDKIFETIRNFLKNFFNKSKKLAEGENAKITAQFTQEYIDSIDFTANKLNIMPYDNVTQEFISSSINSIKSKVTSINSESDPNLSSDTKLRNYLFTDISKEGDFRKNIVAYYSYKNANVKTTKEYSGEALKTLVTTMIKYCNDYPESSEKLQREINSLNDAARTKALSITDDSKTTINSKTTKKDQQKTMTTVTNNGKEYTSRSTDKASMIMSEMRLFTTAVMTAMEKKYYDYIKALRSLSAISNNSSSENNQEEQKTEENK